MATANHGASMSRVIFVTKWLVSGGNVPGNNLMGNEMADGLFLAWWKRAVPVSPQSNHLVRSAVSGSPRSAEHAVNLDLTTYFFSSSARRHCVFGVLISGREAGRAQGVGGEFPQTWPAIARYPCMVWLLFADVPSHQTLRLSPAIDNSRMRGQSWNQSRLWIWGIFWVFFFEGCGCDESGEDFAFVSIINGMSGMIIII